MKKLIGFAVGFGAALGISALFLALLALCNKVELNDIDLDFEELELV